MFSASDLNLDDVDDRVEPSDLTDVSFDDASSAREIYLSPDIERSIFSFSREHDVSATDKTMSALVHHGYRIVSSHHGLDIDRIGNRLRNVDDCALHRLVQLNRDVDAFEFQRRHEQRGEVYEIEVSEQCETDIKKYASDLGKSQNDIAVFFLITCLAAMPGETQGQFEDMYRKAMQEIENLETLLAKVEIAETMSDEEFIDRAESI